VKVVTIGHSEEGREMIAAAIADPSCSPRRRRQTTPAWLNSPTRARSTSTTSQSPPLIDQSYPVYYITGTIHSPRPALPRR
jgi:hypothetical protein